LPSTGGSGRLTNATAFRHAHAVSPARHEAATWHSAPGEPISPDEPSSAVGDPGPVCRAGVRVTPDGPSGGGAQAPPRLIQPCPSASSPNPATDPPSWNRPRP